MKPRIILFHSEESVRVLLSAILKTKGYEVRSFSEPVSCPLYAGRDLYCSHGLPEGDVLIVYDRLPRMAGLNFLRILAETGCGEIYPHRAVMAPVWPQKDLELARELGCKTIEMPLALQEITYWLEGIGKQGEGRWELTNPDCPLFLKKSLYPACM